MWIVMLNGGLGNQMFQYIFALFLVQNGARVMIDDAAFFGTHVEHNSFEVSRFFPRGVLPRLSEYFSPDVWADMVAGREQGRTILEQLRAGGLSVRYVQQSPSDAPSFEGETVTVAPHEADRILALPQEQIMYFYGYWINPLYFEAIHDSFLSLFQFPPFPTEEQRRMAEEISSVRNTVAIHVRRGDMARLGRSNPPVYFRNAIEQISQGAQIDQFFLFSDDISYCMAHEEELGLTKILPRLTVVDGNRGVQAYVDMQLMSLCRFRIADRSSFSQLAGLLCRVPGNLTTTWNDPHITAYTAPV